MKSDFTPVSAVIPPPPRESIWQHLVRVVSTQCGVIFTPVYISIAILLVMALLSLLIGIYVYHYVGFFKYLPVVFNVGLTGCLMMFMFCLIYDDYPRIAWLFLAAIYYVSIYGFIQAVTLLSFLLSPFPPCDHAVAYWDWHLFHYSVPVFVDFMHAHCYVLCTFFRMIYNSWYCIVLVPFLYYAYHLQRYLFVRAILIVFVACIVGDVLFYCFPVFGPAVSYPTNHWLIHSNVGLSHAVWSMHHGIVPKSLVDYAVVGLPSFHVVCAVLVAYFFAPVKRYCWLACIWAALVVLSTLVLGEHYLIDVLAAIPVLLISIPLGSVIMCYYRDEFESV